MSDYTLRQLYEFCREHALDCEAHVKPDGRMALRFDRYQDRAIFYVELDFDRGSAGEQTKHLPEYVMANLKIPPVVTEAERVRLETPR